MHKFVFYNDEILSASEARIRTLSSAALYGRGIFTTVAIYNQKPFLWEKHWRRLRENAAKINVDLSDFPEESVKNSLAEIIEKNQTENARARLTFFDESPSKIWKYESANKTSLLIQTAELKKPKENFRLTVSPFPINSASPLAGVKSCNYLENILAFEDAKNKNFDEAVRLNERGEIASACLANIFWLKDGKLFTPSLKTGCLAGTTREFVLENSKVFEVSESLEILQKAEAIFLASAGIGIVPAAVLQANYSGFEENLFKIHSEIVSKTFGEIVSSISPYSFKSPV